MAGRCRITHTHAEPAVVRFHRLASRPHGWTSRALASVGLLALGGGAVLASGVAPGCNVYGPWLFGSEDAAAEAGIPPCNHATFPGRPATDDASNTGMPVTIVAAMQSIDLGVAADGGPIPTGPFPNLGWDLDGYCTCPGPPSCMQAQLPLNCDDDAGRDHTGLELFRKLGVTAQAGNAAANQAMKTGQYGLVVQIAGYNSQPNDPQVSVSLYASGGVLGTGDGGTVQVNHDGNDKWSIDPRYVNGGPSIVGTDCAGNPACSPLYIDDSAYVANGVLVAQFPEIPITFGGRANLGGAVMDLTQAILVGKLTPFSFSTGGSSYAIENGSISGRWGSSKLLSNMATIPDPTQDSGAFLCGPDTAYQLLKTYICSLQDIPSNPGFDISRNSPCDAISMAFGFSAEPARLGVVAPQPPTPAGCVPDGGAPFTDTCPL
jgi:hypothetical protein